MATGVTTPAGDFEDRQAHGHGRDDVGRQDGEGLDRDGKGLDVGQLEDSGRKEAHAQGGADDPVGPDRKEQGF
jgi:hypothetical protein